MAEILVNDVTVKLASAIGATDLTLTVDDASDLPGTGNFRLRIDNEILLCTGVAGTTLTVTRAVEAVGGVQAATSHAAGADVELVLTAGAIAQYVSENAGGTLSIGDPITSATANGVLYADASGNLANGSKVTHDGAGQVDIVTDAGGVGATLKRLNDADVHIELRDSDDGKRLEISGPKLKGYSGSQIQRWEIDEFTWRLFHAAAEIRWEGLARLVAITDGFRIKNWNNNQTGYIQAVHVPDVVTLADAATIATDASKSNRFKVAIAQDRTLGAPTNPTDGQICVWRIENTDTSAHTLSLTTGSAGAFRFGNDIPSIGPIASQSVEYITAQYDSTDDRWDVTGLVEGY